jgi:hypothetical protein
MYLAIVNKYMVQDLHKLYVKMFLKKIYIKINLYEYWVHSG